MQNGALHASAREKFQRMVKGTVSRDFLLLVFFMNQFPPSPRKFAEIFASKRAPPVSTTPVANFATSLASVVDTSVKFAAAL